MLICYKVGHSSDIGHMAMAEAQLRSTETLALPLWDKFLQMRAVGLCCADDGNILYYLPQHKVAMFVDIVYPGAIFGSHRSK